MRRSINDYSMSDAEIFLSAILRAGKAAEKDTRIDDHADGVLRKIIGHVYTTPDNPVYPDRKTLCSLTGYSPLVVSRALASLTACGYLMTKRRVDVAGQRATHSYAIRIPTASELKAEIDAITAAIRSRTAEGDNNG